MAAGRRQIEVSDEIDDLLDEAAVAELDGPRGLVPWTNRLQPNGDPQPAFILRNLEDKQFICPRQEYLETSETPTLKYLCLKWGVPYSTVANWRVDQNWPLQREKFWAEEAERMWEASAGDIASMRGKALMRITKGFKTMGDIVLAQARLGEKERFVNGGVAKIAYDPKDIGNLSKAYEIAAKGELAAMGLNLIVQRDGSQTADDDVIAPVQMMVFNMPATTEEQQQFMALPAEALSNIRNSVEGEIVESSTQGAS